MSHRCLVFSRAIIRKAVSIDEWISRCSNLPTMRMPAWSDIVYVYVSSDKPRLFLSLYDCFSHRRVHLLCFFFFPLLLCLPLRLSWLTATMVINWCLASLHAAYLSHFFLSLFLLANRPTFVNSVILLRRPRWWWRWLPASSYFPPDSGFPAAGASIRRPNMTV